jgi:hypothetical protein
MTREVMGTAPAAASMTERGVDFDLGELERAAAPPRAPEGEPFAHRLRRWPARSWRVRSWRGLAVGVTLAAVAGFAGWHVGVQHSRNASEARISAHPPVIAWLVDSGLDPASSSDDPREDVELHVLNVGPDRVQVRSISGGTARGTFSVRPAKEVANKLSSGEAAVTAIVLTASCDGDYSGSALSVGLTRWDATGNERRATITAGGDASVGAALSVVLAQLCNNPSSSEFGPAGVDIQQTSGTSGATVTVTNHSPGLRQVEITSDESPAFELVVSSPGPQLVQPGESREIRVKVRVLKCNAIVGLQDWASTITLQVVHRGESLEASASSDTSESYPIPDLVLVPGGAAIQRACNP